MWALDTETFLIEGRAIPRLVLATVSNGQDTAVLRPDQLAEWIVAHLGTGAVLVTWNAKFDFAVVRQYLDDLSMTGETHGYESEAALKVWDSLPGSGRLRDGMLLDFLVRLADPALPAGVLNQRGLAEAALDYLGLRLKKDKEVRCGFGDMADPATWGERKNREALDYAARDAWVTFRLYQHLQPRARMVEGGAGPDSPHGLLTETLQVRADIALDEAGRRGLLVDPEQVEPKRVQLHREVMEHLDWLKARRPDICSYYLRDVAPHAKGDDIKDHKGRVTGQYKREIIARKKGGVKHNELTNIPQLSVKVLREMLTEVVADLGLKGELPRTGKTKELSTALDWWREEAGDHDVVRHWAKMVETAKLHGFVVQLSERVRKTGGAVIQSDYNAIVRTGRTSCRKPNIQQMPKAGNFREMFIARPGHKLVIADYAAIELVTLAAVLEHQFGAGKSTLARVLREGRKPHDYTAALVMGIPYEDFLALKKTDPELHKARRQAAKAINFGVPGGLGAAKLALYAKANYGVDMQEAEAKELRERLITQVYPELSDYLADSWAPLARALRCSEEVLPFKWAEMWGVDPEEDEAGIRRAGKRSLAGIPNVLGGLPKRDGSPYSKFFTAKVWQLMRVCNRNPALRAAFAAEEGSWQLRQTCMSERVTTLTGRVRAGVKYTEARNTPFQGLAADGAKVALWQLREEFRGRGWHTAAFVHDEIVAEVPEADAGVALVEVPRVMREAMRGVLACDLPVEVEAVVSGSWTK